MRNVAIAAALAPSLFWLAGCAQGLESRRSQVRVIPAPPEDVYRAAQVILRREFGPLELEPGYRRIVTRPVEYHTDSGSGTARDLYRGRTTLRRTAHFSAAPRDGETLARLRIDVERQDTARREMFQPQEHRLSDAPSRTAIERDAATTTEQNTVWTHVRRDTRLERQLLDELEEQFAPPPDAEGVEPAGNRAADAP